MKTFTIIMASLPALVASVAASPTSLRYAKRQIRAPGVGPVCMSTTAPSAQDVENSLNTWLTEVNNVNTFLNGVHNDLSNVNLLEGLARGALDNASDEPNQLGVLACISGLIDDAENAIASAAAGFGDNVLMPLMDVTTNGADTQQVLADVAQINQFRCCTLLPGLDILWLAAAEDEGLVGQVTTSAPRPNACAAINC
ncbi:hypothetical protein GQ53DRAFT_819613 [Thozetella sp. PMI_491]|nr:hypothetical protein GQ53DRAFT_819613 [Thozetella sp. PMI_491]